MFNRKFARQMPMNFGMQEGMIDIDNNSGNIDLDFYQNQQIDNKEVGATPMTNSSPIIEPMRERVVQRTIMHEVKHVCPVRTKIINNHVFKHTYTPNYTCCEENVCSHIQCGSCCNY